MCIYFVSTTWAYFFRFLRKRVTCLCIWLVSISTHILLLFFCVQDMPEFQLSVDLSSKVINVTMEPGERKVYTRWCYKGKRCTGGPDSPQVMVSISGAFIYLHVSTFAFTQKICFFCNVFVSFQIDPSQSRSTVFNMSYLLPCLCVEVCSAQWFLVLAINNLVL